MCPRSSKRAPTLAARLRCAATSRPKATSRPARSPISRRIRRTTRRSTPRSISSAASKRTRPTLRTPRRRFRTRVALSPTEQGGPSARSALRLLAVMARTPCFGFRDFVLSRPQKRASEAKFDPRICSIWPPSGHLFMFTRGLTGGCAPTRGAERRIKHAFRKTRDTAEHDQPAETEVEAEIREFVRRDVVTNRERQPENESGMVANSINSVLQRATTTSVQEIDKLITELQTLRHMLHSKGAQVQREIVQYSTLTTAALHSTKIIAESLTQLKKAPDAPTLPDLKDRSVAS